MSLEADIRRECGAFTPGFGMSLDNYNPFDTSLKFLNTGTPKAELNLFDSSFRTHSNTLSAMDNDTKSAQGFQNIQQENEEHHSLARHPWTDVMFNEAAMPMSQTSPGLSLTSSSSVSPSLPTQSPPPQTISLNQFHSSMTIEPRSTHAHNYEYNLIFESAAPTKNMYSSEPDVDYFSPNSPTSRETFIPGGTFTKNTRDMDNCHHDNDGGENEDGDVEDCENDYQEYDTDHDRRYDSDMDTAMSDLDMRRFSVMSDSQSTAVDHGRSKRAKTTKTAEAKELQKEAPSPTTGSARANSGARKTKGATTKSGPYKRSSSPEEEPEMKRQKFLERNRMAASKCREKKRLQTLKTISDADEITSRNQELHETLDQLKEEVRWLKNQILCHRDCGCDLIQKFVQRSFGYNAPSAVLESEPQMQLY